jgi:hypothetical protein
MTLAEFEPAIFGSEDQRCIFAQQAAGDMSAFER